MSKFFRHDEYEMIQQAVESYRKQMAGTVWVATESGEDMMRLIRRTDLFATRVEQALRGTDWRRVEKHGD